jgi:hypothetical protein
MKQRDRRRFYRVNAWCAWFAVAAGLEVFFASHGALRLLTLVDVAVVYANYRTYKAGKRLWIARRDEAFSVFAEAVAAVPEFAKYEGNVMTLQMNGFTRFLVWHDECWVEKSHV